MRSKPSDRKKDALVGICSNIEAIADYLGAVTFEQFARRRLRELHIRLNLPEAKKAARTVGVKDQS